MQFRRGCKGGWLAPLALAIDQWTKALVRRGLWVGAKLAGLVRLHPVVNRGAAFSMLSGQTLLLTLVTALLIGGVAVWLFRAPDAPRTLRAGLWLIVGGGIGNLIDRLCYGFVFDFIELTFVRFAIFNVADICICIGAGLALLGTFLSERKNTRS